MSIHSLHTIVFARLTILVKIAKKVNHYIVVSTVIQCQLHDIIFRYQVSSKHLIIITLIY